MRRWPGAIRGTSRAGRGRGKRFRQRGGLERQLLPKLLLQYYYTTNASLLHHDCISTTLPPHYYFITSINTSLLHYHRAVTLRLPLAWKDDPFGIWTPEEAPPPAKTQPPKVKKETLATVRDQWDSKADKALTPIELKRARRQAAAAAAPRPRV